MPRRYHRKLTINQYLLPAVAGVLLFFFILSISIFSYRSSNFHRAPPFSGWEYQSLNPVSNITVSTKATPKTGVIDFKYHNSSIEFQVPLTNSQLKQNNPNQVSFNTSSLQVQYETLKNGLKENIILSQIPATNEFISHLKVTNADTYLNSDNLPVFFDPKTKQYLFHVQKPYAFDAKGNKTYAVTYQLLRNSQPVNTPKSQNKIPLLDKLTKIDSSDSYSLVLKIDSKWLFDKSRAYPITIDPTIIHDQQSEFATGSLTRIKDVGAGDTAPSLETSYQELPSDQYTVALWHMNETAGTTIADSSGNGYTGTLGAGTSAPTLNSPSIINVGASFNGSTHYINTSLSRASGDGTVELWFKMGVQTTYVSSTIRPLISQGDWAGTLSGIGIATFASNHANVGKLKFIWGIDSGSDQIITGTTYNDDKWHHIAITKSGSIGSLYIDGQIIGTQSVGTTTNISTNFQLGGSTTGSERKFKGLIDEVRISSIARSSEQIKADAQRRPYGTYTSPVLDLGSSGDIASQYSLSWNEVGVGTGDGETLANSTGLVAQWNFNELSGTTVYSIAGSCGSACNGALNNFNSGTGLTTTFTATGGSISYSGGYTIHTFTSSGTFTPNGIGSVEVLVVGGGGGSGGGGNTGYQGGGGGGGGVVYHPDYRVSSASYAITVGNGGAAGTQTGDSSTNGGNGGSSTFASLTANGGGGGGGQGQSGLAGGSGGGGGLYSSPGGASNQASYPGATVYGRSGGSAQTTYGAGGGGGGAGGNGGNGSGGVGGSGGYGISSSISGSAVYYGGGGAARGSSSSGSATNGATPVNTNGAANTGAGGGGNQSAGGYTGGSGIVIVRYPTATTFSIPSNTSNWTSTDKRWGSGAITLDGINDYISLGDSAALQPAGALSVESWFKTTSTNDMRIIRKRGYGYGLNVTSGKVAFFIVNSAATSFQATSAKSYNDGLWHHAVGVYNGSSVNIYVDGQNVGTTSAGTIYYSTGGVSIGRDGDYAGSYLNGTIDTTRIYSRALTPAEILSNYNAANVEFQTRVGNSSDPNDGTWEDWKPGLGTTETSLDSFDTLPVVQPNEISNLALWLKSDTINLNNDAAIDNWLDSSGNNRTFSQAVSSQRPIYRQNILNGKPVVHFTSSLSQTLTNSTNFGTPSTFFYVSRQTGGANGRLLSGLNNNWLLGYWSNSKRQAYFAGWISPYGTPPSDTNWHIYDSTHNGLISEAYEDGNLFASNSKGVAGPNGLSLNGYLGTSEFSNGEIAEVIAYSKALSTDERRNVEKYLSYKYNLPLATPYSETNDTSIKVENIAAKKITTNQIQPDFNTVGLWHFDETSGSGAYLKDSSTYLNHGTPTGTTVVNGVSGKARQFNGTSDTISIPDNTSLRLTAYTVEVWFYASQQNEYWKGIFGKPGRNYNMWLGNANNSDGPTAGYIHHRFHDQAGTNSGCPNTVNVITWNTWHHVVLVNDGSFCQTYVDGVLQASGSVSGPLIPDSGNVVVGSRPDGNAANYFNGKIDEIKISNVALTAEEIAEDYRLGANHYLNDTIATTDLSDKSALSFYVAADRPGQYLNLSVGNNAFSNYQADSNTVALWHLDDNITENFRSCYAWRQAGYTTDGAYTIDPDGPGGNAPFQAYCNMTYDGGGWTMILKSWYGSNLIGNANAVGAVADATTQKGNPYKLSDQSVRDIIGPSNNFDVMADQNGYNSAYSTGNFEFVIIRNYTGVWTYEKAVAASSTTTTFQSYRISDKALAWTGNLSCGYDSGSGVGGINCYDVISNNPQGGAGCTINMGSATNAGWHHFFMNQANDDTYLYICNGAQHSSSFAMNHRFWVRERVPTTSTIKNSASVSVGTTLSLVSAVGGTITSANGYTIHTFKGNGTFQVVNGGNGNVEALVIGGGGGGANTGGGGGGGGFVYQTVPVSVQSYSITVGNGGAGGSTTGAAGSNGGNSVFSTITALGGGGGSAHGGGAGSNGGSGGGGAIKPATPVSIGGTGYQGYNGGDSTVQASWIGNNGGGGGAGGPGGVGSTAAGSGAGGSGHRNSLSGSSVYYAGGGGGSNVNGSQAVGAGGGGGGGSAVLNGAGGSGTANTGGGGAGGSYGAGVYYNGGNGGSGIVIIRYPNVNSTIITPRDGLANGTNLTQGILGKARNFNGTTDHIDLGNPTSLQVTGNQTIDMWLKPTSYDGSTRRNPFHKSFGGEGSITLEPNGLLSYYYGTNGSDGSPYQGFSSRAPIPAGQWSHIAVVRDLNNMQLKWYINGVLVNQETAQFSSATPSTQNVYIGKGYVSPFLGAIDEVRVSNVARSSDDIRSAYESGLRTHPITIDFSASLSSTNLITGSGDLSFTIDATTRGLSQKGAMLFNGDKIIIKENVNGTEYIAQGTVNSVSASTGNTTVSSWDAASTFPPSGFTANADVFKWQREFFQISQRVPSSQINGITTLSLRLSDGNEGRNIWLDDLKSSTGYLTNNLGSTLSSTTGSRYLQYRLIETTTDTNVSPSVNQVTLSYTSSSVPGAPSNLTPGVGTTTSFFPSFSLNATDSNGDYLRYKILLCTNSSLTSNCQTFDQTSSQLNWAGQNTQAGSAYTSGTTAYYSPLSALKSGTTYYWKSWAIDPGGSNLWGATQSSPNSFTTVNQQPTVNTCTVYEASDKTYLRPQWQINSTGFSSIEVQRKRDDDATFFNLVTLGSGITGYYDYGVPLNHTYQYQIAPIYPDGTYGSWCQTSILNLNAPPTIPTPTPTSVTYPDRPALML